MFEGLVVLSLNKLKRLALSFACISVVAAVFILWIGGATVDQGIGVRICLSTGQRQFAHRRE